MASDRRENRQVSHSELYDSFRNSLAIDDIFIPLLTNEKILSIVVQLLGAHLQLMTSHLIYKHPDPPGTSKNARSPGWHRDYGSATKVLGNGVPRILLKCGYYLTDLSEPNSGATLVAPGSNHLVERIKIPEGQSDPTNFVEPSLKPGDCLLFENRTWHAGGGEPDPVDPKRHYDRIWLPLGDANGLPDSITGCIGQAKSSRSVPCRRTVSENTGIPSGRRRKSACGLV